MTRYAWQSAFALVAWLSISFAVALADDAEPAPSTGVKPRVVDKVKAPEFAGYSWVAKVTGEVVKANDSNVTVRIFWQAAAAKNSTGGRRPSLHGNPGGAHHSPYATRHPNVQIKWEHHDYDLPYVADSLVRTDKLPPKIGPDGKRGFYSENEQNELKIPHAVVGWQASKADLKPGAVVDVHLIRDKTIPANKVTDADLRIKYAVIIGQDPNPPKDIASPPKTPPKKN